MPTKKLRGGHEMHVPTQSEAMGLSNPQDAIKPGPVRQVREAAGHGYGGGNPSKSGGKGFTTIHKGKDWDGGKPRVSIPKAPQPKHRSK